LHKTTRWGRDFWESLKDTQKGICRRLPWIAKCGFERAGRFSENNVRRRVVERPGCGYAPGFLSTVLNSATRARRIRINTKTLSGEYFCTPFRRVICRNLLHDPGAKRIVQRACIPFHAAILY